MTKEIYTPYGFRDRLFAESAQRQIVMDRIRQVLGHYGYREVETPMVEYLKVYDEERGSIATVDMYKFSDRDGELLVLRPDLTPAAARVATTYLTEKDLPCRMSMSGSIFRYNGPYSAKERQLDQIGAERIGTDSAMADAEVLEMAIEALKNAGLKEFKIAIGHAKLVKQILSLLPEETRQELSENIVSKNFPALYQKLARIPMARELRELVELTAQTGEINLVEKGLQYSETIGSQNIYECFRRLSQVHQLLKEAGLEEYLVYDLGMTVELHYYTGIVFQGYTYGTGDYIMDGGRYDDLLKQFAKDWPAVGFGISINSLLKAMDKQGLAPEEEKSIFLGGKNPIGGARYLRQRGYRVTLQPDMEKERFEKMCDERTECLIGLWLEEDCTVEELEQKVREVLQDE